MIAIYGYSFPTEAAAIPMALSESYPMTLQTDEAHRDFDANTARQNQRMAVDRKIAENAARNASQDRLVRRPEVEDMTGLSRSTINDWMKHKDFPKPVRLGSRLVAWRESDLSEWLSERENT